MNSVLTRHRTLKRPPGFVWETLIVDPRFRDRFRRAPRPKRNALFWALAGGSFLITVAMAVSLLP